MDISTIIAQIDAQVAQLEHAKTVIAGLSTSAVSSPAKRGPGRLKGTERKLVGASVSMEAKRGRPKGPGKKKVASPVKAKRTISAQGKARIAAAQRARWANAKKAAD